MSYPRPPGVYFERLDASDRADEDARSDIAGFVGVAERGPLHTPVRVESWTQFRARFGRPRLPYAHLPEAVRGFFANGGRRAWIVRVGRPLTQDLHAYADLIDDFGTTQFRIRAKDPGLGGALISIRVLPAAGSRIHLYVDAIDELGNRENLESWRDLELEPYRVASDARNERIENDRYLAKVVNGWASVEPPKDRKPDALPAAGSVLIEVEHVDRGRRRRAVTGLRSPLTMKTGPQGRLGWESDPTLPSRSSRYSVLNGLTSDHFIGHEDFSWGLSALERIDEVALVAIPDLMWHEAPIEYYRPRPRPCSSVVTIESEADLAERRAELTDDERRRAQRRILEHCARIRYRFAVLDVPLHVDPCGAQAWADELASWNGQFGALYFPWIGVSSPTEGVDWMPPSGHLAGVFARVDLERGVQKSPANESMEEVQGVLREVDDGTHGRLNDGGVNVLRACGLRGVRAMGARTLIDRSDPDLRPWRYISVRRLLLALMKSLERAGHWLVHGDNGPQRRFEVERRVRQFLLRQWQNGRLGGSSPEEAFSVECDESTNPAGEVETGRLTCLVGVQPPLPAEFLFVRLGEQGGDVGNWSFGGSRG